MRPVKNLWPNTDGANNMKFFAQLMRDMLRRDAFESFRAPSLDTLTRLTELSCVLEDVSVQRLPSVALDPIIEELIWSLQRDPVAKDIAGEGIESLNQAIKFRNMMSVALGLRLLI